MYDNVPGIIAHALDETHVCYTGRVPDNLFLCEAETEELWEMHPSEHPIILMHGNRVPIPRWQQAYGTDYHFSGQASKALPVPSLLAPLYAWVRQVFDARINGLLVNWYEAALGHYIGAHRDSTKSMCSGAPIVMVSYGATRTMRLKKWKGKARRDFVVSDGSVCILPFATNLAWTHEVLRRKSDVGRRISVTFRAFDEAGLD